MTGMYYAACKRHELEAKKRFRRQIIIAVFVLAAWITLLGFAGEADRIATESVRLEWTR